MSSQFYLPNSSEDLASEGIKLISQCPFCQMKYQPSLTKILEERRGAHLVHLECFNCGSSIVALIISGGLGVSSIGLLTDLTSEDVIRFKNSASVSLDNVIEIHELLNKNEVFWK